MGLLKDSADGKEPNPENDPEEEEKKYEKMFLKMGRDFITKEDFVSIMTDLIERISNSWPGMGTSLSKVPLTNNSNALLKAMIYKDFIENEKDGVATFATFDLAKIEESEDSEEDSESE